MDALTLILLGLVAILIWPRLEQTRLGEILGWVMSATAVSCGIGLMALLYWLAWGLILPAVLP